MDQGNISPETGSLLMTRTAGTKGLPPRVMGSLTQALLKQTSLCSMESMIEWERQVQQMAGSPNCVPKRKVDKAYLFLLEGSKDRHTARAEDVACFNKSKSVLVATKTTGSCFLSLPYGLGVSCQPSPSSNYNADWRGLAVVFSLMPFLLH